jgi:putative tricarboxylic transport membrane protein
MFEAMGQALVVLFSPQYAWLFILGIALGLVIGAIPGLSGIIGLAMLIPFCVKLKPEAALPMLIGMLAVTHTSDSIPAVLFGTPGTVGCQSTVVDGYPMARQGAAGKALGVSFTVSAMGGIFGALLLTLSVPVMKPLVLAFGSPEFLAMCLLGVSLVGVMSGSQPSKGIIAAGLGMLIAMIGIDPIFSVARWSFNQPYLIDRLNAVPMALGFFAIPELADLCITGSQIAEVPKEAFKGKWEGFREGFRHKALVLSSSAIGALIGIMPGMGTAISTWLCYSWAVVVCKPKDQFGKGDIRGVIAPEAANNAGTAGALIPTLAFGVPGSTSMAILLAAFYMVGVPPGPKLLTEHVDLVYLIFWTLAISNLIAAGLCFWMTDYFAKVTKINIHILAPLVIMLIYAGAYTTTLEIGDIIALLGFGMLGYIMKYLDWPRPPLILGFVLCAIMEKFYFHSSMVFGNKWLLRPYVIVILGTAVVCIYLGSKLKKQLKEESRASSRLEVRVDLVFTLVVIAATAMGLYLSRSWPRGTALFPRVIGSAVIILSVFSLIRILGGLRRTLANAPRGPLPTRDDEFAVRAPVIFGWLVGFCILTWAVGFEVAAPAYVFFYMRLHGKVNWSKSILFTAATVATIIVVYGLIFGTNWPVGAVWEAMSG